MIVMISSIIASGCIAFLGYLILYKCCSILCENKKTDLDGLIKEYQINGITRIFLETFKLFAENVYFVVIRYNFFNLIFKRFFFQADLQKPIMKDDKIKDKVLLFEYLISLLDSDKKNHTATFKQCVESIWQDKWSFFAHSGYVGHMLNEIGDICKENSLPIITFLIVYKDKTLAYNAFQEKWRDYENGWEKTKLKIGSNIDCKEFQEYLALMVDNLTNYKKTIEQWKKDLNYDK